MTHKDPAPSPALGIEANSVYPLTDFQRRLAVGRHWMRAARRDGLRVLRYGGRSFVTGADFLAFISAQAEAVAAGSVSQ